MLNYVPNNYIQPHTRHVSPYLDDAQVFHDELSDDLQMTYQPHLGDGAIFHLTTLHSDSRADVQYICPAQFCEKVEKTRNSNI